MSTVELDAYPIKSIEDIKHGQEAICIKSIPDKDNDCDDYDDYDENLINFKEGKHYILRVAEDLDIYTIDEQNDLHWLITRDDEDERSIEAFNDNFRLIDKVHKLYSSNWEEIDEDTQRLETPKGWLVRTMGNDAIHQVFIEDTEKAWILEY